MATAAPSERLDSKDSGERADVALEARVAAAGQPEHQDRDVRADDMGISTSIAVEAHLEQHRDSRRRADIGVHTSVAAAA